MNLEVVKTAVVLHGITASGKSSFANSMIQYLTEKGLSTQSFSTDDFFITSEGRYRFDVTKLAEYHAKNLDLFMTALKEGTDVIICDNTNLVPWQSESYTNGAREYEYKILFVDFKPRSIVEHFKAQEVTEEYPDAHGIPKEAIERMINDYDQYRDLLYKDTIIDIKKHVTYVWDNEKKQRVVAAEPSKYFELDHLIVIEPEDLKESIDSLLEQISRYVMKGKI